MQPILRNVYAIKALIAYDRFVKNFLKLKKWKRRSQ
jgi:hypothetical protein